MKTNLLKIVPALVASVIVSALVATKMTAGFLDLMSIGVSYTAVAVLVALAAVDYRSKSKSYSGR